MQPSRAKSSARPISFFLIAHPAAEKQKSRHGRFLRQKDRDCPAYGEAPTRIRLQSQFFPRQGVRSTEPTMARSSHR